MRAFDTLSSMSDALAVTATARMTAILAELVDHVDPSTISSASFTSLFDFPVFLIEQIEELQQVLSCEMCGGERLSVLSQASDAFDIAYWTDDNAFAVLGTIETDLGGPQYFIPKAIADQVPNVGISIQLSQGKYL